MNWLLYYVYCCPSDLTAKLHQYSSYSNQYNRREAITPPLIFALNQLFCVTQKGDNLDQQKNWEDQLNQTSAGSVDQLLVNP